MESIAVVKHGYIVHHVLLCKTLEVNHAQLLAGMAWWYRYYAKDQSTEDRGRYESAEDEAKAGKRGLWADPGPINPYDWRKGDRY